MTTSVTCSRSAWSRPRQSRFDGAERARRSRVGSGLRVDVVDPVHLFGIGLNLGQIEVDDDRLLAAANDYAGERRGGARIDLLVWHERGDEDEIARTRLGRELEPVTPSHPGPATHDVDHALQGTVVMCAGLRIRLNDHRPGPELLGTGPRRVDRCGAIHPRRLWRGYVEVVGVDHAENVEPPV